MNWDELEEKCFQAAFDAIKKLLTEYSTENFYAFSLYTDSSAMTVSLSANSEERLHSILDAEKDKSRETQSYYKWATSEWAYEGFSAENFSDISKALRESPDRANFLQFKNRLVQALINALKKIKLSELAPALNDSVLFVSITDDDDAERTENISAGLINDKSISSYFLSRYD
ncbi:DUF4303 domain-containing protein [Kosakonia sacchari]